MSASSSTKISAVIATLAVAAVGVVVWQRSAPQALTEQQPLPRDERSTSAPAPAVPAEALRPLQGDKVRDKVHALTDQALAYGERCESLGLLRRDLTPEEIDYLYEALAFRPDTRIGTPSDWWVVLNEIMVVLRNADFGTDRYPKALAAIIGDPTDLEVPRDYAVQHLSAWLGDPSQQRTDFRQLALDALVNAVNDPTLGTTTIPGTAISTLTTASPDMPAAEQEALWTRLDPVLEQIVSGTTQASVMTRTSAIQSVAMRQREAALPAVRELAAAADTEASVRLSSVAALGFYGRPEDRTLIEKIRDSEPRLKFAATAALDRIQGANP